MRTSLALGLALLAATMAAACIDSDPDPDDLESIAALDDDIVDDDALVEADTEALAAGPAIPFGSHLRPYGRGIAPTNRSRAELDDATRDYYDAWKRKYLKKGCGTGRVYVATGMSGKKTVSEAHGYGMVILAFMAGHDAEARSLFDGMYKYFVDHPTARSPDLLSWSQDSQCRNNDGNDSATDGDLDVAYGLLLADKQWGSGGSINYKREAKRVIAAIGAQDVERDFRWVLLGNWAESGSFYNATRTSDFMPGHFAAFADATGDDRWDDLVDDTYKIVATLQRDFAASTGLLPDFVKTPATPKPASANFLEGPNDGKYSWNACRDPWRLAVHYLTTGDTRAKTAVQKMTTWIKSKTSRRPDRIKAGYGLNGTVNGGADFLTMAFASPFGVAAMVDSSNQTWLNDLWTLIEDSGVEGYYEDTIKLQVMIAMSGNWWAP